MPAPGRRKMLFIFNYLKNQISQELYFGFLKWNKVSEFRVDYMKTRTRKASAIVALVAAIGVATVELPRSLAQAGPVSGSAGYAGARVDEVFKVVAEMLPVAQISIPMAVKGDLEIPLSCVGPFQPNVQAECMDVAYEVEIWTLRRRRNAHRDLLHPHPDAGLRHGNLRGQQSADPLGPRRK